MQVPSMIRTRWAAIGAAGECDVPATATGLVLNVTAVGATLPTFLTVYPAGAERPNASSLNPSPGQPPVPNAVTTNLGSGGRFSVYNYQGTVDVIADVVGYFTDHTHDDRYYTRSETDGLFTGAASDVATAIDAAVDQAVDLAVDQAVDLAVEQAVEQAVAAVHADLAPMSPVTVGIADVAYAQEGWDLTTTWIREVPGVSACLQFAVDLPVGASVTGVSVTYEAAAPANVMAAVAGTPTGPKTYAANPNSVYYFSPSNALAATAASTITVAATTPDALVDTVPVSADASTSLVVCSADALHIYGASVTFTQP